MPNGIASHYDNERKKEEEIKTTRTEQQDI
jgi:hypothetical protein